MDRHLPRHRQALADYFAEQRVDAMIFPTSPLTARPIRDDEVCLHNGEEVRFSTASFHNVEPMTSLGIPGLSLPSGIAADGLPVGIELDGLWGSDRRLIAIGLIIERIIGSIPAPPAQEKT